MSISLKSLSGLLLFTILFNGVIGCDCSDKENASTLATAEGPISERGVESSRYPQLAGGVPGCILRENGRVSCWINRANVACEEGRGAGKCSVVLRFDLEGKYSAIDIAGKRFCGVTTDGVGRCGVFFEDQPRIRFVFESSLSYASVAVGGDIGCFSRRGSGAVICFPVPHYEHFLSTGYEGTGSLLVPTLSSDRISLGDRYGCALPTNESTSNTLVKCWGGDPVSDESSEILDVPARSLKRVRI